MPTTKMADDPESYAVGHMFQSEIQDGTRFMIGYFYANLKTKKVYRVYADGRTEYQFPL